MDDLTRGVCAANLVDALLKLRVPVHDAVEVKRTFNGLISDAMGRRPVLDWVGSVTSVMTLIPDEFKIRMYVTRSEGPDAYARVVATGTPRPTVAIEGLELAPTMAALAIRLHRGE